MSIQNCFHTMALSHDLLPLPLSRERRGRCLMGMDRYAILLIF